MATASSTIWLVICKSSLYPKIILEYFIRILVHPQLPYHMIYQPAQQVYMRPQFPPQHQSQQPQQLIGGVAFVSENNLTSSSTGILQASVSINSHRQHVTVDTSTVQYDSYSQHRSQVEMYNIKIFTAYV